VTLKVFISYKSEYRPFARALQTRLKEWGYPTWLDVDNIRPGEYFRHKIQEGLDTSDALVVVLTEEAQRSREVMAEVDYFLGQQNKPVVPLRHQDCKPLYIFVSIQYIDFVTNESNGFEALRTRLAELNAAQQPAASGGEAAKEQAPALPPQNPDAPPPPQPIPPPAPIVAPGANTATTEPSRRQPAEPYPDKQSLPTQAPARRSRSGAGRWQMVGAAAVLLIAVIIVPQLMQGNALPPDLTSSTRDNTMPLLIIGGLLLLALVGVGAFLSLRRRTESTFTRAEPNLPLPKPAPDANMEQQNQPYQPEESDSSQIDDLLSMDKKKDVPAAAVLRHTDYGEYPLAGKTLAQVFDDLLGQMLVLGTAQARQQAWDELAAALLARSKADDTRPVPLRLQLNAWLANRPSFDAWLAAQAIHAYAIPEQAAQAWVEHDQLTLLLDGLDGLSADQRTAGLAALQAYRRAHPKVDVVLGGSAADFDALTQTLDIRGAVLLAG
jgi:hypothetical protein